MFLNISKFTFFVCIFYAYKKERMPSFLKWCTFFLNKKSSCSFLQKLRIFCPKMFVYSKFAECKNKWAIYGGRWHLKYKLILCPFSLTV